MFSKKGFELETYMHIISPILFKMCRVFSCLEFSLSPFIYIYIYIKYIRGIQKNQSFSMIACRAQYKDSKKPATSLLWSHSLSVIVNSYCSHVTTVNGKGRAITAYVCGKRKLITTPLFCLVH